MLLLEKRNVFKALSGYRFPEIARPAPNSWPKPGQNPITNQNAAVQYSLTLNYLVSGIHILFTFVLKCSP